MAEPQQKASKGCPGLLPSARPRLSPYAQSSKERHQCLDNWNTFRGQFFTGPPARPFPTMAVSLPRTQPTDQQLPHPQSLPPAHPCKDITHSELHTQHTSSTASRNAATNPCPSNLSPPTEYFPPIQAQYPSALGISRALPHTLPRWTAGTS